MGTMLHLVLDKIISDLNIDNTERNITIRGKVDFICRMLNIDMSTTHTTVYYLNEILKLIDFKLKA